MWEKIFTEDAKAFLIRASIDTEDENTIKMFEEHLISRADVKSVLLLASKWHDTKEGHQVKLAIKHAGIYHASRFMMLMDFLAHKIKREGEI